MFLSNLLTQEQKVTETPHLSHFGAKNSLLGGLFAWLTDTSQSARVAAYLRSSGFSALGCRQVNSNLGFLKTNRLNLFSFEVITWCLFVHGCTWTLSECQHFRHLHNTFKSLYVMGNTLVDNELLRDLILPSLTMYFIIFTQIIVTL